MKSLRTKTEPERVRDNLRDSISGHVSPHKDTFLKGALIAGGAAVLTAGSAAISSFRRRTEAHR
jgi:hypothetical protein